jgi:hypothetical protein
MDAVADDARLVAATRRGDRAAFGVLIDRHRDRVRAVVFVMSARRTRRRT